MSETVDARPAMPLDDALDEAIKLLQLNGVVPFDEALHLHHKVDKLHRNIDREVSHISETEIKPIYE